MQNRTIKWRGCREEVIKGALGGYILSGGSLSGALLGAGLNYYFLC